MLLLHGKDPRKIVKCSFSRTTRRNYMGTVTPLVLLYGRADYVDGSELEKKVLLSYLQVPVMEHLSRN
jgi:hypothetical protein